MIIEMRTYKLLKHGYRPQLLEILILASAGCEPTQVEIATERITRPVPARPRETTHVVLASPIASG